MTVYRDGEMLSDAERRILRGMEREMEASDLEFVAIFRRGIYPMRRVVLAAVLVAAGVLVVLATFPISLAAATVGLVMMGAGIRVGLGSTERMLRNRIARFAQEGKAEDVD